MSKLFIDKVKFDPFNFHELSEADWQRYNVAFTPKTSGYVHPRIESHGSSSEILSAGYKLEEGATATPWCPSINDLATGLMDIQAIKSKLGG